MKTDAILARLIAAALFLLMVCPAPAPAGTLFSQPYDGTSPGAPSQMFTDTSPNYSSYNTEAFDDFTVPAGPGWIITGATFYGQEQGDPTQNVSVNMQMLSAPGFTTSGISGGSEDASGNLNFTGLSIYLAPGTYWITAWVDRPELTGGQWFWDLTDYGNPHGSEFYIQNPGGGLIPGASSAVPASTVLGTQPSDLAFTLYGSAVPEPSGAVLLAIGGAAMAIVGRRSRARAARPGRA